MSGAAPSFFLSDLHVRRPGGPRMTRVLDFLGATAPGAAAVYLVGDVFDFWLGYRNTVFSAFFPLLRRMADLVDAGTRVVLFSGNHDPDPGRFFREHLGVEVHEGPLVERLGRWTVHLEHGDLVDPRGLHRRAVCRVARSRAVRAAARLIHPELAWRLARAYGGHGPDAYDAPLPRGLVDDLLPRRARAGADVVVLGHYHRAVRHEAVVDGRPATLFVLGDWVGQHTYLRFDPDAGFTLLRHRGRGRPPIPLPPGDHGPDPLR